MPDCKPLSGAVVEVWQADARGVPDQLVVSTARNAQGFAQAVFDITLAKA